MDTVDESGPGAAVSGDDLVARAKAIAPGLRERQEICEQARQVPDQSLKEMTDAGLYQVLQPRSYGGFEHTLGDFVRIGMEIGAGCGSTAWVYSTGAQHNWMIGMFPPQAQEDIWGGDPQTRSASSFGPTGTAVRTDGGYRLSGKWSFCSGVDEAEWMLLGVRIAQDSESDPTGQGFVMVPEADYAIEDNWHVLGLIGTGSKNVILEDVFVPAHHMLTLPEALSGNPPGAAINTGPLFKIPFFAAISVCLCAPALGMARGALDDYLEGTRVRQTRGAALSAPASMADYATIQLRVGEAAAGIDAATQLVLRDCAEIMAIVEAGRELEEPMRARNKADLGYAVKLAKHAADLLFESAGGQGLFNYNRLQRSWRDIHAASKHLSLAWDATGALYGRVMLGRPAGTAQF